MFTWSELTITIRVVLGLDDGAGGEEVGGGKEV